SVTFVEQRSGSDADRVCEVDDPSVLGRSLSDLLGNLEQHRNCAHSLGKATGPGRFLANRAELVGQRLVYEASLLAADSELNEHQIGAAARLCPVLAYVTVCQHSHAP